MAVDPAELTQGTVADVLAWANGPESTLEEIKDVLAYEIDNKNRVGVVDELTMMVALVESTGGEETPVEPAEELSENERDAIRAEGKMSRRMEQPFDDVTVTTDCVIQGTSYSRGDVIPWSTYRTFKKLNVLLSNRTLLPSVDPWGRRTDNYGFGDPPRKHPTPTSVSPRMQSTP